MENPSVNLQLVEKLIIILKQAQSSELTSFAAVTFRRNGSADQWGFLTRYEDSSRVVAELEALTQLQMEMAS